jgi:predicted nucleic acid-binding protein
MAAYFFDTSGIVKRYIQETGTAWVQAVTDPAAAIAIYLARISAVEVTSAAIRRQRAGHLSAALANSVLAQFRLDFAPEYRIVEITSALLEDAMRLAESHALRANDALQLAAVVELQTKRTANGLTPLMLASADQEPNSAVKKIGLAVEDPNLHP